MCGCKKSRYIRKPSKNLWFLHNWSEIDTLKIGKNYEILIETRKRKDELRGLIDGLIWFKNFYSLTEITVTEISREGRNKGFNVDLYKNLRKRIDSQFVAHGGAGPLENIVDLFNIK